MSCGGCGGSSGGSTPTRCCLGCRPGTGPPLPDGRWRRRDRDRRESGGSGRRRLSGGAERGRVSRDGTQGTGLRRGPGRPDMSLHLSFWKRIAGLVIAVAVILLLSWITLNPPKLPQLEPCPDDWLYYKRKCYYHSGAVADWDSSQEACSDYGASLAVINSRQELNFIMYRIRITDFWIGLRRKGNEFFWVNGESFDTNLFHINITNDGDCVHIDSSFISTRRCSSLRNWLCTIGWFNPKTSSL
ncbi:C-type lectin domain family 2 member B-like isoform X1 [Strix uralensis]|uniref:C-type lectin domain family 2 member B-like isoform X1 n=1 Tax=Strix uralensis TaxID=36305 RepID=UPI003DA70B6F